jgi:hypothetical protein
VIGWCGSTNRKANSKLYFYILFNNNIKEGKNSL